MQHRLKLGKIISLASDKIVMIMLVTIVFMLGVANTCAFVLMVYKYCRSFFSLFDVITH